MAPLAPVEFAPDSGNVFTECSNYSLFPERTFITFALSVCCNKLF